MPPSSARARAGGPIGKVLWVKFGWSDYYRGGPVDGNFPFIEDGEQGHEAWNFLRQDDGTYYCYVPPQGPGGASPWNDDPDGWTVICLAKHPKRTGIHVVGWYEDATLEGDRIERPDGFDPGGTAPSDAYLYTIRSKKAFLVPPELRTAPFSHPSVRQGKYSFLAGPDVTLTANKRQVLGILEGRLEQLSEVVIAAPDPASAPDRDNDPVDPLRGFGTPEHRKAVEEAAVEATKRKLKSEGYDCVSKERDNIGFDLEATHKKSGDVLHVEVKGTSGQAPRFFMTANEVGYRQAQEWRLAMVVDALRKANVQIYTLREFERDFELAPMVWKGVRKESA